MPEKSLSGGRAGRRGGRAGPDGDFEGAGWDVIFSLRRRNARNVSGHFEGPHLGTEPKPPLCLKNSRVCLPHFRALVFSPPSSSSFPPRVMRTTGLIA